ncbi:transglutaminase family protein [Acetobacter sp. AN02]|uniref:transglutaminase family protein n=1 Tax=Acetobacter sp. AN02 TaxID=2894186 RepID=UPI0024342EEE|nr:transglutaminase family protein [Acetobacter sp. AN02]MDG6094366.1 transglutaminase family protein [Acetobacter sp. AN02]
MIYRVRHITTYAYGRPVDLAAHILHVTPRDLPGQRVLRTHLSCEPDPVRRTSGRDSFGNHVSWLFHEVPHDLFRVIADSEVDVSFPPLPEMSATLSWEQVARMAASDGEVARFLFAGAMCPTSVAAGAWAAESFAPGRPVLEAVSELNTRIYTDFRFCSGVTNLRTTVEEVLEMRQGVCQDFTHLMVSGLRALGLPARYMSGYIRTRPPPGQKRRLGADVSHAWAGVWLGPEIGWAGFDPTNGIVTTEEHVVLGWGLDYADISPVRGLILGGGGDTLRVGVDLVPADEWEGELFPEQVVPVV